jgi:GTP diphosphokinase / guanosine-3',5'-bis(diphosphate) 3'-diphosphatase
VNLRAAPSTVTAYAPPMDPTGTLLRALDFAAARHRDQRRKDVPASPYINHPIGLATVLWHEGGVRDPIALVAAVLHDTVEDTATTIDELREMFGPEIAGVVAEVTDDRSLPREARKRAQIEHAPHLSLTAKQVKLADKLCNLRDILDSPPADWSHERRAAYVAWTAEVVAGLRGACPPLEAAFDAAQARWATP